MTNDNLNNPKVNIPQKADCLNVAIAAVIAFVCCLALPFTSLTAVAVAIAAIASAFAVRVSTKRAPTMIILTVTLCFAAVSGSLPFVSLLLAATVGCGALAWLMSKVQPAFIAIIPSLAYAISTVITRNWFTSLITLLFILPSVILAHTYKRMNSRVTALLKTAVGFALFFILATFFSVLYSTGEFRFEVITEALDSLRDSLVAALASIEMATAEGTIESFISETDAFNIVSQFISLLPALVTVLCSIMAYLSQRIQFSTVIYNEGEDEFSDLRRVTVMSPASATVFILSFLIYTFTATSSSAATVATVCANLYLIFLPGLALMGAKLFFERRRHSQRRGCSSMLVIVMLAFAILLSPGLLPIMAACYGAFSAIETPVRKYFANKKNS